MSEDKETRATDFYRAKKEDPEDVGEKVIYKKALADRRGFLRNTGLAAITTVLGSAIPFHRNMPNGFIPIAMAEENMLDGKEGLTVLNDRPMNAETPPHLLDDAVTPTSRHFIRNNGTPPYTFDADTWALTIDGLVDKPIKLTIADLKKNFEVVTKQLVIECGGNGRAMFNPPARGNQWTYGAVACSEWTGVRLLDVLNAAGVQENAIYTAHEGADTHLSGVEGKLPLSRGMPISKALMDNNLIAFEQNGAPLHAMNGAPLRLVVPGWPGSCSQKWLTRIWLRDVVHDGPKMTGKSYRVPNHPVAPGTKVATKDFRIIEAMPVKSLITYPQAGIQTNNKTVEVRGQAWAGDKSVKEVHISYDFGATWIKTDLSGPANKGAWQQWNQEITLPQAGYYEIWAKAVDSDGVSQPFAISWNPKGYLNNSFHRIAITVT